jgi:putative transposase
MHSEHGTSLGRLARAFDEPRSSVGRWVAAEGPAEGVSRRRRPVGDAPALREAVRREALHPRQGRFGYRRITAVLRRQGLRVNRKTVYRIMKDEGLLQTRIWHRSQRPKRVEKMRPEQPNAGWQIDMTSFQLSDLTPLYLVTVIDCCTRQIVGWTLDRRCRATEWIAAVRMALDARGLAAKAEAKAAGLVLRSDNGAQPCSKAFVEFLGRRGVRGQYTGYDAPDDNAYVERVIRTIKEEEIWPNQWDRWSEAHAAIEQYVAYYNDERIHSALAYQTPNEAAAAYVTLAAA